MGDLSKLTDEQVDAELAELEALLDEEEMGKGSVAGAQIDQQKLKNR